MDTIVCQAIRNRSLPPRQRTGVPACQRASSFHKYTRARTCIYFRKLLARWHTGTLLTFYSLSTHSPMSTQNSTIIKISPF